jgi:hypothetical protein
MEIKRCRITVRATEENLKNEIHDWFLDTPCNDTEVDSTGIIDLRGWVATPLGTAAHFVLRTKQRTRSYPCNDPRPDVVQHFANAQPPLEIPLHCGFHHDLQMAELFAGVRLGMETRGIITWVATITAALCEPE